MLGQLTVYIKGIRDDFITRMQNSYSGNKDSSGPPKGRNMPEIVNNIVWVRQLDSKVWFQTITVNVIFLTILLLHLHVIFFSLVLQCYTCFMYMYILCHMTLSHDLIFFNFVYFNFNDLRKFDLLNKPL